MSDTASTQEVMKLPSGHWGDLWPVCTADDDTGGGGGGPVVSVCSGWMALKDLGDKMTEGWCGCRLGADSGNVLICSWVGRRFWKGSFQQEDDPRQLEKGGLM